MAQPGSYGRSTKKSVARATRRRGRRRQDEPIFSRAVTCVATTNIFTANQHGLSVGTQVAFTGLTGGAGITAGQAYHVIAGSLAVDTFTVSATPGGVALDVTTDLTAGTLRRLT